jgi:hypothetical protein
VHWWKILKEEPKWLALFDTEKDKTEAFDVPEEQKRPLVEKVQRQSTMESTRRQRLKMK